MMSNMHLMADSLGLGSCWIQDVYGNTGRRVYGRLSAGYIRISGENASGSYFIIGISAVHPEGHSLDEIPEI